MVTILKPRGGFARRVTIAALLTAPLCAALPFPAMAQERMVVAQAQQEAQLALRIQQLEEQVRSLTGQVEGLQFQLAQMQTLIQKMTEDNEYRFQQLEGGAPAAPQGGAGGKTEAAPQAGGVTPSGEAPQAPATESAPQGSIQTLDGAGAADAPILGPDEQPMDDIGLSHDPLLGTNDGAEAAPLTPLPQGALDVPTTPSAPLDLNRSAGTKATQGDADAQYAAGYDAIVKGDYSFAEQQFRQFLDLYPDDPQAADATNWLGEALLQRKAYGDAAEVLVDGYQKYPSSSRAPDLLLKLGMALSGADERDTACRTFAEIPKRYTSLPAAFKTRLAEEQTKAQCPPA